ncbi:heme biosynthesis protein HemY [Hellea balneolensis]|uniref:heme biosynthesis protein HemY n=1 Tax=Hellea balneolensis TaxID=287478 RepID=UPI000412BA34|nr:heme biosynthesis HemY N-terminal domain-containing protein [Hellea balneolensis]
MTKYVIAILVFLAALAGLLLYVGNDPQLILTSTATTGPLQFSPLKLSWQLVIGLVTFTTVGLIALWSILGWLWRLPSRVKSGVGLRRRNQALDAMEEALIAGSEGDMGKARKKAEKARALIGSEDLGRMVSAQAAEACGDSEEAIAQYQAMLESERTLATGQRGLAQQLLTAGNLPGAIEHASRAYSENKNARWAFDILFQAQVADHQWAAALETLENGVKRKHIDKDLARRRSAVLSTAEASRLSRSGQSDAAMDMAVSAAQDTPEFSPAVALAAKLLGEKGAAKKAGQLIEKAWSKGPHPALSLAYRDINEGASDKVRAKLIKALIKNNPDHRESTLLEVEELLSSGDAVTAWSKLSPMVKNQTPSARICSLAAKAETMLSNAQDARVWLERAATALAEPDWSDLDPEGDAFDYTDQDWRRLIYTYGEKGELIHPRYERGAARRAPLAMNLDTHPAVEDIDIVPANDAVSEKDESMIESAETKSQTSDLAERLDSLLDKPE